VDSVLDDARARLPLELTDVETDFLGARISGPDWHLRINTEWRIVAPGGSTALHLEQEREADRRRLVDLLVGRQVVGLALDRHGEFEDIRLVLDDGSAVEVVSEMSYGEWLFTMWHVDDPRHLPVYDLPGPY